MSNPDTPRTYPETVEFLYALGNEVKTIKLGLDRIRILLRALGDPQNSYSIVHVAGTNGKGSVCAMIDAGLRAAGVRSGMFTSPHLIEPTERIQIDGIPVSRADFERAFHAIHQISVQLEQAGEIDAHPTYFESVTAMALWMFREQKVQTAVVEVGLGGRLDATNVVHPALTVITPVDMDHQFYLGNTIEQIAAEKAGILKPGVPAVFSRQRPDVAGVLDARAAELGIFVTHWEESGFQDALLHSRGSRISLAGYPILECNLPGEHQVENAITAAQALIALGVSPEGISEARWPGRLEHVAPNPDVLLDGAHNPAGAQALRRYLERFYGNKRIWMIFGAMRDKAVDEVGVILFPLAHELIFTAPQVPGYAQRALTPPELIQRAGRGHAEPTVEAAIQYALSHLSGAAAEEDVILITGSLYLVGEARKHFLATTLGRWPASL
ncbi:MAG: folylpolyglutamate synthase/dihydrofolate synthase family protein [Acidobacteriota bacterium]